MRRPIIGFGIDDEGDPIAILSCGHPQHVRHRPPFINREWVTTEEGRRAKLGETLNCVRCERFEVPEHSRTSWSNSTGRRIVSIDLCSAAPPNESRVMAGKLVSIFVAEKSLGPPEACPEARLIAGKGIVGDRRFKEHGTSPEKELTLVESEQVNGFNQRTGLGIPYWALRRNLLTSGIELPSLVGKRFRVGEVEAEGIELCEPCSTIARLLSTEEVPPKRVIVEFMHRAGLRARILTSGVIRPGDAIDLAGE